MGDKSSSCMEEFAQNEAKGEKLPVPSSALSIYTIGCVDKLFHNRVLRLSAPVLYGPKNNIFYTFICAPFRVNRARGYTNKVFFYAFSKLLK